MVDTTQSIGQMPVDVTQIGCDFACGTGRKWLRGPRGLGFLYAKKSILDDENTLGDPPLLDHIGSEWLIKSERKHAYKVNETADRYELCETPRAGQAQLAVACDEALEVGLDRIQARVNMLA